MLPKPTFQRLVAWRPGPLIKSTLHTSGWYAARVLLQMGSLILLARILGADGYGALAGTVGLYVTFAQFAGLGSGTALMRHLARHGELYGKLVATQRAHLVTSAVLFMLIWPVSTWLFQGVLAPATLAWLAAAEIIVAPTLLPLAYRYQAQERMNISGAILTFPSFARFCAVLTTILSGEMSVARFAEFYLGCLLLAMTITFFLAWPKRAPSCPTPSLNQTLREGIPYVLSYAFSTAGGEVDKTILLRSAGSTITGQYAAAYRIMQTATLPVSSLIMAATARMFRSTGSEMTAFAGTLFLATAIYALLASAALALFAPFLHVLFGPSFSGSEPILKGLCVVVVTCCLRQLTVAQLTTSDLQKSCNIIEFIGLSVSLTLLLLLIPHLGAIGAIMALAISDTIVVTLGILRLRQHAQLLQVPHDRS